MKAISIKQPWASLIVEGIKPIENRTWPTKYRGKVFIHASAKMVQHEFVREIYTQDQWDYLNSNNLHDKIKTVPLSAIIGEVEIVDCVIGHESIWAETGFVNHKPIYNWVLANPVKYPDPIKNIKGKLSFWVPKNNSICMVCDTQFFGPEAKMCCDGRECGCMGRPTEPIVCSEKCYNALFKKDI